MSYIRPMVATDLLNLERVNLQDDFVTTFNVNFYLEYLAKWPQYCHVICSSEAKLEGYIIGKSESSPPPRQPTSHPYSPDTNRDMDYLPWHAHITALAIAPECRRLGHARKLTELFENVAEREDAWFVDLFVRADNEKALGVYGGIGYSVFRKVVNYYADAMDGFDMRKPMKRDAKRQTVREHGERHEVDPGVVW